jgi:hypothetical protein
VGLGLPDGREHDNVLVITKPDRLPETSSTAARRGGVGRLITGPAIPAMAEATARSPGMPRIFLLYNSGIRAGKLRRDADRNWPGQSANVGAG